MKNLKMYKRALAILTASTLVLMNGCGKSEDEKKEPKIESCKHVTIYFEEEPVTFKECEGYIVDSYTVYKEGCLSYNIYKDNKLIIKNGYSNQYNEYEVYHEYADEIIKNESVEKSKIKIK